jgi:hypothetical protein
MARVGFARALQAGTLYWRICHTFQAAKSRSAADIELANIGDLITCDLSAFLKKN